MTHPKPLAVVDLSWDRGLTFTARDSTHAWVLDGRNQDGPSPVVALAAALAGCMSIDLVAILTKGRHQVHALSTHLVGDRADDDPRRFLRIELRFTLDTNASSDHIQHAIDLSREKYCSVWHSLRQDIELVTSFATEA